MHALIKVPPGHNLRIQFSTWLNLGALLKSANDVTTQGINPHSMSIKQQEEDCNLSMSIEG